MLAYVWYTDEGEYTPEAGELAPNLNKAINRALHEESLLQRSYYDYLTGLPSMTHFFELAAAGRDRLLSHGGTPALLFIDLSGMKGFNSKYGFAEGDALLRAFSQLLIRRFGRDNCSRFGQDHFAVVTKADELEERLNELFLESADLNGGRTLPVRAGIQIYNKGIEEISAACDRAKTACASCAATPRSAASWGVCSASGCPRSRSSKSTRCRSRRTAR
ncbi:MAG: GGDEF domain-containing protein [Eubacteriales bacterium]|nr:GGDEF domain-containing protein [Eubacteriales bacterium]